MALRLHHLLPLIIGTFFLFELFYWNHDIEGLREAGNETLRVHPHSTKFPTICQSLDRSPRALWRSLPILEASMQPLDVNQTHRPWVEPLLELLTPYLGRASVRSPAPRDTDRILSIVQARLTDPKHNPPLQVAILGGSVPEGSGCERLPAEVHALVNRTTPLQGRDCAWPYRLQLLADRLIGPDVIEIHNLGVGGTGSSLALPNLRYRLLGVTPDVVVNAFAVNDNLWNTDPNNTATYGHFSRSLKEVQDFVEAAVHSVPCRSPPVVVYLDDYFGNQNEALLGEQVRNDALRMAVDYLELAYIRLPWAKLVHVNQAETLLSPQWMGRRGNRNVDGHYFMTGHVAVAWAMAYATLQVAVDHCWTGANEHDPRAPSFVPPRLDDKTAWKDLPKDWKEQARQQNETENSYCQSASADVSPCPFAFVATPAGNTRTAKDLDKYLKGFITARSGGWKPINDRRNGWQNKIGLHTDKLYSYLTLKIPLIRNPVRFITLHSLKSYGELWDGSEARFEYQIYEDDGMEALVYNTSRVVQGFHNDTTSIAYPMELDLGDHAARIGQTVVVNMTLVSGPQFKIISLLLCSR